MELTSPKIVSFIDLGTNSARLLVVRLNMNHSYTILTRQKEVVRLGEGEFSENYLTEEAISRTVAVITGFVKIARSFQSEETIAVATSATRDARNRDDLITRVREEAEIELNVISGPEEARLIWLGVSSGHDIGTVQSLFIDIGGGSTEIIVGDQTRTFLLRSLKLGAIRTTTMFIPPDLTGPVPDPLIRKIRQHVRGWASHTIRHVRRYQVEQAFGSSGTISSLELIAAGMKELAPSHQQGVLTRAELSAVVSYLSSLPLADRRLIPGLNPDRADIIVAGALILDSLLEQAGISRIQISSRSLRDGLLVDYLSKIPGFPYAELMPVRESSVRQLGRSCHISEHHADHVTRLAFHLFDSAQECGLHALPGDARELLGFASYLHDVGQFISFSGHHQHSYYLITNAPLLGFHDLEILMMALIARYHRKKLPRRKDPGYSQLSADDQATVQILALFLRMAENLDRSHDGRVTQARLSMKDRRTVQLTIGCESDWTLEEWAIRGDMESFEQTFKKELVVGTGL
jgi:exopolyphosphatase / guanosine-5'-triphosphate,3'-diphosphate pyrophosphatase